MVRNNTPWKITKKNLKTVHCVKNSWKTLLCRLEGFKVILHNKSFFISGKDECNKLFSQRGWHFSLKPSHSQKIIISINTARRKGGVQKSESLQNVSTLHWWSSNAGMRQNFLEGLLKHRVLGPNPRFSESISLRISISKNVPSDTDAVVQQVRRPGRE